MKAFIFLAMGLPVLSFVDGPIASGQRPMNSAQKSSTVRHQQIQAVIDEVEVACRHRYVYMIGPQKARRLAELVREKRPRLVVECGTAIGYSGLWIARELLSQGSGSLITIEFDPRRAAEAAENFRRAKLSSLVQVRQGDARRLVTELEGPVDFLFLDCNYENYLPCFKGIEDRLEDGAVVVADNAGAGASGMAEYLKLVREKHESRTEWFDLDLPWSSRDAMEITIIRKKPAPAAR